ncbi:MAG: hypothetical protein ACRCU0_03460 [Candidatus Rhabdochlamydia sp.]
MKKCKRPFNVVQGLFTKKKIKMEALIELYCFVDDFGLSSTKQSIVLHCTRKNL